jgi:hypothetical protein
MMTYPALFQPDPKGGILVKFPDFGHATHGDNQADACSFGPRTSRKPNWLAAWDKPSSR